MGARFRANVRCIAVAVLFSIAASTRADAGHAEAERGAAAAPDTQRDAVALASALAKEIAAGVIDVETTDHTIVIRVKEHGSFASGSAELTANFRPVLKILRGVLKDVPGEIAIEGHTDDLPIASAKYRSNWALSSARAVSVAQALFEEPRIGEQRFSVTGYADTWPIADNATPEGRARNRRVDIVVNQSPTGDPRATVEHFRRPHREAASSPSDDVVERFDLKPDEVF